PCMVMNGGGPGGGGGGPCARRRSGSSSNTSHILRLNECSEIQKSQSDGQKGCRGTEGKSKRTSAHVASKFAASARTAVVTRRRHGCRNTIKPKTTSW